MWRWATSVLRRGNEVDKPTEGSPKKPDDGPGDVSPERLEQQPATRPADPGPVNPRSGSGLPWPASSPVTIASTLRPFTTGEHLDLDALARAVCLWPPDSFSLTHVVLNESEAYRIAVSPPTALRWPPLAEDLKSLVPPSLLSKYPSWEKLASVTAWSTYVRAIADEWVTAVASSKTPPSRVLELWERVMLGRDVQLHEIRAPSSNQSAAGHISSWEVCTALLELHAIADAACVGVGLPDGIPDDDEIWSARMKFVLHGNELLRREGALNIAVPARQVRVLPKMRTAQVGITVRSLSLHLSAESSPLPANWLFTPTGRRLDRLNLLLLPWPFEVSDSDFRPIADSNVQMDPSFGFFEFQPGSVLDPGLVADAVREAKRRVGTIHGVVFPELAVAEADLAWLEPLLATEGANFLLAGIRRPQKNVARLTVFGASEPVRVDQDKHHRWCIEANQIRNYHLGFKLLPTRRWWEAIRIEPRALNFFALNSWLTMCHLICEDLARVEPVSRMIRCVGPNLVIALLMDGPQLKNRWPGRYATVLADDPGSSVLTLTSLGMSLRSRPNDQPARRTIGLWTDPVTGSRELELSPSANAMILGIHPEWATEWSADGRSDRGAAARPVLNEIIELLV